MPRQKPGLKGPGSQELGPSVCPSDPGMPAPPWAWGGSLSPHNRLSDLCNAPSHSSPFEFEKEKKNSLD